MNQKAATTLSSAADANQMIRPCHDPCVFVLGCDRSGTTLVQKMLTSHNQLHITYEAPFSAMVRHLHRPNNFEPVLHAIEAYPQFNGIDIDGLREDIRAHNAVHFADLTALLHRRVAAFHGKSRWGDKTPAYTRHVLSLAMMFPAAGSSTWSVTPAPSPCHGFRLTGVPTRFGMLADRGRTRSG